MQRHAVGGQRENTGRDRIERCAVVSVVVRHGGARILGAFDGDHCASERLAGRRRPDEGRLAYRSR